MLQGAMCAYKCGVQVYPTTYCLDCVRGQTKLQTLMQEKRMVHCSQKLDNILLHPVSQIA